ncbi:MAG TPA: hypothetical protein VN397_04775 [Candidatus Methylomirabilis sp.]|nr:hypothetical protein [Candidatus Methylomirabilis sp.]
MTFPRTLAVFAFILLQGAGCWTKAPTYVKATPSAPVEVKPNVEGAKASTGGADATITPQIATEFLVSALPIPKDPWTAADPVESRQPVPLPDGTRSEVTRVDREYRKNGNAEQNIRISITDTRGIPALLLFMNSFEAYNNPSGYRKPLTSPNAATWLTYALGPNGAENGTGSVIQVYRERFLIQIDGGTGVSADELEAFVRSFDADALK